MISVCLVCCSELQCVAVSCSELQTRLIHRFDVSSAIHERRHYTLTPTHMSAWVLWCILASTHTCVHASSAINETSHYTLTLTHMSAWVSWNSRIEYILASTHTCLHASSAIHETSHYTLMTITWYPYAAVRCSALQCVAVCCSVLQCVAACCGVLQTRLITIT